MTGQNDDCHIVDNCDEIDWVTEFNFGSNLDADPGVEICIPVTVNNFLEIISFEFSISFNPEILQFSQLFDPQNLVTFDPQTSVNDNFVNEGFLNILYTNVNLVGVCLDDNTEIFSLCFIPVGDPGECTQVTITSTSVDPLIEVSITDESFVTAQYCPDNEFVANPGTICIGCNSLNINSGFCSTSVGTTTGAIFFEFCGGTGPYNWTAAGESGSASEGELITIDNLGVGMYTVTVEDANGNMLTENIQILNQPSMDIQISSTDPTCLGRDDGEVSITITDGFEPYFEAWSNFEFETDLIDDLSAGTYTVTVTDGLGCQQTASATLILDTLKVMATVLDSASCAGSNDGVVELIAQGGNPTGGTDYTFITPSGSFTSSNPFNDGTATDGWYYYQVQDGSIPNCVSTIDSIFVPNRGMLDADIQIDSTSCFGVCDGFFRIEPNGGSENYLFLLTDSDFNLIFGGINIGNMIWEYNDLCPGDYIATVTDANFGCQESWEFSIFQPDTLVMSEMTVLPTCSGADGSISLSSVGGTEPYSYLWDDGDVNDFKNNLGGGEYCVTVTDDNGCQDSLCVTLTNGGLLEIDANILETIDCPGSTNGKTFVDVLNGSGSYNFAWFDDMGNQLSNQQTLCDLGAGMYIAVVEDLVQACISEPDTIILAPGIALDIVPGSTSPLCPGDSDGIATVTVTGGSGNPSYLWDTLSNMTNTLFGVPAGEYCVTITDGTCEEIECVVVDDPPAIILDIKDIQDVTCFGGTTGEITIQATGGTVNNGNYFYTIFDENMQNVGDGSGDCITIPNIPAGNLFAFASDGQCPSEMIPFTINQATRIEIDDAQSIISDVSCFGQCDGNATVVAIGGTGPYDFFWPDYGINGATISGLCPGVQYVEITDNLGCTMLDSIELNQPDTLIVAVDPFQTAEINCNGGENGIITIFHTGGNVGPFTYNWSPNVSDDTRAENLGVGLYEVTVTDVNGCTDSLSYSLDVPPAIVADIPSPPQPLCFGEETCITVDDVTGGVPGNYTFSINQGIRYPIDTCINVIAGQYTVTVFDADGCSTDTSFFIDQPFELEVDLGPDFEVELGDSTETLQAVINSFLPIDSIMWSPDGTYACTDITCDFINIFPTSTQSYFVTVTDSNGCTDTDEVLVRIDDNRNVYFPNIFSPNNDGQNDLFQLFAGDGVEMIESFRIFDRWGNMLFEELEVEPEVAGTVGWDGNFKGNPVNPGIFVYVARVKFVDGVYITYSKDFTLLR